MLAYHGIEQPEAFAAHLDYLRRHHHPVSLEEVLKTMAGGSGLPDRSVLLTFDDGERSLLEAGMPALVQRGMPGVAFVVAGLLDTDVPYWWREVEELAGRGGRVPGREHLSPAALVSALKEISDRERLAALAELRATAGAPSPTPQLRRDELPEVESAGIAVGNHSLTHPCLDTCGDGKVVEEITGAHEILSEALGHPPVAFAYPNGNWDRRVKQALEETGYQAAFLFDHRQSRLPVPDPLLISRVRVRSTTSLDRLATIVSGLHPWIHHSIGRA